MLDKLEFVVGSLETLVGKYAVVGMPCKFVSPGEEFGGIMFMHAFFFNKSKCVQS